MTNDFTLTPLRDTPENRAAHPEAFLEDSACCCGTARPGDATIKLHGATVCAGAKLTPAEAERLRAGRLKEAP